MKNPMLISQALLEMLVGDDWSSKLNHAGIAHHLWVSIIATPQPGGACEMVDGIAFAAWMSTDYATLGCGDNVVRPEAPGW